ncbi:LysE/ArgO family amino acid transporter [Neobacillus terrae]|uniref:LysE/ArgO family amino acid transporter n=1 Tax=Neobacillus terrae TaxID=3034837 RepID=UPI00140937EC|nr:LysE/ArgO family amino acid transporter [Neobacillus terrae]NHM32710.1 amino acid transporter [Neobacillus terrae]
MFTAAIHGFTLALGLILPLGVQNIFIFNQGAVQPRFSKAIPAILTAALCDTLLIVLAVVGISVIVLSSTWVSSVLLLLGIVFLIYMGIATWKSKPSNGSNNNAAISWKKQIIFAASVSLLNPHAIMDTIGVIGTSSLTYSGINKIAFTISCIAVSWLWFAGLAAAGRFTGLLNRGGRLLVMLNKLSAVIMFATAVYLTLRLL